MLQPSEFLNSTYGVPGSVPDSLQLVVMEQGLATDLDIRVSQVRWGNLVHWRCLSTPEYGSLPAQSMGVSLSGVWEFAYPEYGSLPVQSMAEPRYTSVSGLLRLFSWCGGRPMELPMAVTPDLYTGDTMFYCLPILLGVPVSQMCWPLSL